MKAVKSNSLVIFCLLFLAFFTLFIGCTEKKYITIVQPDEPETRVLWVPDDYQTIQGAINASRDGDTVRVRDGIFAEGIDLLQKRIWLESENGPEFTIINAETKVSGITVFGGQDSTLMIRGFTVMNAIYYGIWTYFGCGGKFCNNIIIRSGYANWEAKTNYCIFINNVLADNAADRYNVDVYYSYGRFENNLLVRSGRCALWNYCLDDNPLIPEYNLIWLYDNLTNSGATGPGFRFADNNLIDIDPMLSDTLFHLLPLSPCINAGNPALLDPDFSRSDIGAYGGPYAYTSSP